MQGFDLSAMTEDELDQLIAAATRERGTRSAARHEGVLTEGGVRGQDVNDPNHGAITTPTPHHVREHAPDGLKPGARVEGTEVIDADDTGLHARIEEAARRLV